MNFPTIGNGRARGHIQQPEQERKKTTKNEQTEPDVKREAKETSH